MSNAHGGAKELEAATRTCGLNDGRLAATVDEPTTRI